MFEFDLGFSFEQRVLNASACWDEDRGCHSNQVEVRRQDSEKRISALINASHGGFEVVE
jgi:hypothetical protein